MAESTSSQLTQLNFTLYQVLRQFAYSVFEEYGLASRKKHTKSFLTFTLISIEKLNRFWIITLKQPAGSQTEHIFDGIKLWLCRFDSTKGTVQIDQVIFLIQ